MSETEIISLYADRKDVTLTAYVQDDSFGLLRGGSRPAILICPGGAYLGCSDTEGEPVALRFAAMGYHTFVLRYTTYLEGTFEFPDLTKPLPVKEHTVYPKQMREIRQAMLIIREHAREWLLKRFALDLPERPMF